MRDALSLLDQAIAYGNGEVREGVVRTMLGAVDTEYVYRIVDALDARNGPALLAEVDAMAARSIAFAPALEELASLFHRIAVAQTVPVDAALSDDAGRVAAYAGKLTPESVQLCLPDLRAGPRRSAARSGRGHRVFDDALALARVRADSASVGTDGFAADSARRHAGHRQADSGTADECGERARHRAGPLECGGRARYPCAAPGTSDARSRYARRFAGQGA